MARARRDSDAGDLDSGIAARAGVFLGINYTGGAKDKRIARDLDVSPSMAKMLRGGRGWTVARLDQLLALFPAARDFIFPPPPTTAELARQLEQLARGFDALAEQLAAMRVEQRAEGAALRGEIALLRADVQGLRG